MAPFFNDNVQKNLGPIQTNNNPPQKKNITKKDQHDLNNSI